MEDNYFGYNATSTTLSSDGKNEAKWMILHVIIVIVWVISIVKCVLDCFRESRNQIRYRRSDEYQERQRNRLELIDLERQEREAKILRSEPERREKVIASVIITKRVTKKNDDGGIEFSEQNSLTLTQQEVSETSISKEKDSSIELQEVNDINQETIEIFNDEEMNAKIEEAKTNSTSKVDEDTDQIDDIISKPLDNSCDSYSQHNEVGLRECTKAKKNKSLLDEGNGEDTDLGLACPICLDDFDVGDELSWSRQLKCQHVFHSECLASWLMNSDECPVCRTLLIEEEDFLVDECDKKIVGASVSGTSSSTETEALDSSSGMFLVLNGMVSFVKNARHNILRSRSQDNVQYNIIQSIGGDEENCLNFS